MKLAGKLATIPNDYPKNQDGILLVKAHIPTASFVIPTYNSSASITYVLIAIEAQKLNHLITEVVIVDDASTDDTKRMVKEYIRRSKINIIYIQNQQRKYSAHSRNRGTEVATGEIICYVDSDIIIPPDYLNYHLGLHSHLDNAITLSLRSFVEMDEISLGKLIFPVNTYQNEFRIQKYIDHDWCDTPERKKFAGTSVKLLEETDAFRDLGFAKSRFWTLPEICLGSAICYKRQDVVRVNGTPENFVGWGFNDTALAAKVIALQRYVVPIVNCGVYHAIHPRRSGNIRDNEYLTNRMRYLKLLELQEDDTYRTNIEELS